MSDLDRIKNALSVNPCDASSYADLGDYYLDDNIDRAFLCYEQARFYERSSEKKQALTEKMEALRQQGASVRNVSIVIASYNSKDAQIGCIESIRMNVPVGSYEIVVVDNASTDGIAEWLEQQDDIKLIRNKENAGFGPASNQGVGIAAADNDIFFLNNDTIILPNSIFRLRMGLYRDGKTGATGSVSNSVSFYQRVDEPIDTPEGWMEYGIKNNARTDDPYESVISLVGFALLVKRDVLDKTGLFDEIYGIGNFEDDDLCMRIRKAGYDCVLCHDSFIYHFGSMGFKQKGADEFNKLISTNRKHFVDKWGFDITSYKAPGMDILEHIDEDKNAEFSVLEIGCGCGATLLKTVYEYPHAKIKGVEENRAITDVLSSTVDIETRDRDRLFDLGNERYDYIILGDITGQIENIADVLMSMSNNLTEKGCFILRLYNPIHVSVLLPMLRGHFDHGRKHFYTVDSIADICKRANLTIRKLTGTRGYEEAADSEQEIWEYLSDKLGEDFTTQALTYNYVISVTGNR
ncbi:MAG: glycosyltransferase [Lachnospiraceae bacterium]|nr:glycosyltransferase [Lachnospiraceae bacterium]